MTNLTQYLLPVALLVLMYFMLIRPQQTQAKKRSEMLNSVRVGADIITIGGIHGTIVALEEKTVVLKVASNVELTFNRSAIGSILQNKE